MRRTKLICTLGPASAHQVDALVAAGMDIARVNFSHGSAEEHAEAVEATRRAAQSAGRAVGVLADLRGPKVRLGDLQDGSATLQAGQRFVLRTRPGEGDAHGAATNHPGLADDLRPDDRVLLADGAVELRVLEAGQDVTTEVVVGGTVRSRAGVSVPSDRLSLPPLSDRDRSDVRRALALGVDFIAQSFVRRAADLRELRQLVGDHPVQLLAKLETRPAIEDAHAIISEADGVMLARGDLGVELPLEVLPIIQKDLARHAVSQRVPIIVATQMLESMTEAPRPTRAEASDVANAVLDGADAVMLSAETAIGHYPIEAARMACQIATVAEEEGTAYAAPRPQVGGDSPAHAVARAAAAVTDADPEVAAIACFTQTGRTAVLLASARPGVPIFALCPDPIVVRRLTLWRAVVPLPSEHPSDTDAMIGLMDGRLREDGLVAEGAKVVIVASTPVGRSRTNLLKMHRAGDWPS